MPPPRPSTATAADLFLDGAMDAPEAFDCAAGRVVVYTAASPDHPGRNDDAAGVFRVGADRALLCVADGVGGMPKAAQAARVVLETLRAELAELPDDASLRNAVLDGLEAAHAAIRAAGAGASTVVCAELSAGRLRTYHAGDAAALLFGPGPVLKLQTVSHSPVGYAYHSGLLDEEDALRHGARHLITNCAGSDEGLWIEVGPEKLLEPGDTLLLASDGLLDNLRLSELAYELVDVPLEQAAEALVALGRERMRTAAEGEVGKPDDLTFLLFRAESPRRGAGVSARTGARGRGTP